MDAEFKIVLKPVKVKKKTITGTIEALCIKEDGIFKARIKASCFGGDAKDDLVIPFTKESYDLHRAEVFSVKPEANGRYIRYIRQEPSYIYHPGLDTQYSALCENYIFAGSIITINGKKQFDMKSIVRKNTDAI